MSEHVGVVIPARNEQKLIARCLDSVVDARDRSGAAVTIVVIADACTDATADIAARYPGVIVQRIADGSVGAARIAGSNRALDRGCTWLAHTDADSAVPPNWITEQLTLAAAGFDVMIGTVQPDFADLSPAHIAQWLATHERGRPNGHVHGANLGIRASTYLAVGGFARLDEHEDNELVKRLIAAKAAIVATDTCEVVTSGRTVGRTAGGYAGHLRNMAAELKQRPSTVVGAHTAHTAAAHTATADVAVPR